MQLKNYDKIENSSIDFKESLEKDKPKSWLKTVSAFANSNGGIILFGINDNKQPVGIINCQQEAEKISELINYRINPLPRYELNTFSDNDKEFIELKIGDGPRTPYYYDYDGRKEAFIRAGNESIPAPKHILESLILKGQNITYDELPSKYILGDVSFTLLNASLKNKFIKELKEEKDYLSLELITKDKFITNAGILLCDQGLIKNSKIFCTRWNGLTKGSINNDALDDKEYNGSILYQLENAINFIKNNSKTSWSIENLKRIEKEDYPSIAIREAIVNAIIHRDYQIIGSEIHIDMFDDRIEITSPGGMIDGSYIQDLDIYKIASMRRNRTISEIFNKLDLMDRRGSGLIRIMESYKNYKYKPKFISNISMFKVILPNKGYEPKNINVDIENTINDTDYFLLNLYKKLSGNVRNNTLKQIELIFNNYTYQTEFRREDIEKICHIKKTRALDIISLLLQENLIGISENNKYIFKK